MADSLSGSLNRLALLVADFHFLRPWWLLLVLPTLALFWWLHRRATSLGGWRSVIAPHLLEALLVRSAGGERFRPYQLIVGVLLLGSVAMAGPSWEREATPFAEDTAPLVVALDLSVSMNAIDIQPTRVERAKQKIRDLLELRSGARTGLVVYAGSAHQVLPLTEDPLLFDLFLDPLSSDLMPIEGKNPAAALELAERMLAEEPVAGSIVFFTDAIPEQAQPAFEKHAESPGDRGPSQVMVLGIGTSRGGPIRVGENRYQTDESGAQLVTTLDRDSLERLAATTGAFVTTVTVDDSDVRRLDRRAQSHLEAVQREDDSLRFKDYGYWLVWPTVLLCALWFRKGWTVRWAAAVLSGAALIPWLLVGILSVPATARAQQDSGVQTASGETASAGQPRGWRFVDLWLSADQQGRWWFEHGELERAAERFEDPLRKGIAFYYADDLESAIAWLARVDSYDGAFALGNANARLERYEEALQAYARALQLNPGDSAAEGNRDLMLQLIEAQREDEPEEAPAGGEPSFDPDEIVFDEKGEKGSKGKVEQAAFSDEQLAEMWMRGIQTSPAEFLRFRFAVQAAEAEESAEDDAGTGRLRENER